MMPEEQAYNALKAAAERMGRALYKNGTYRPMQSRPTGRDTILIGVGKPKRSTGSYRIAPEHMEIIDAMSDVLSGDISPDDAMALLFRGDIMELRLRIPRHE